jgi:hypothetical protein
MRNSTVCLYLAAALCACNGVSAADSSEHPGCAHESAKQCVTLALQAMGGESRPKGLRSVRLETIGDTLLVEQSYRQAPFITSYERDRVTVDLANRRVLTESKQTWPESDPQQSDSEITSVIGTDGGVYRGREGDSPCSLAALDAARVALSLGPVRLLLTALGAPDLHFEDSETLRSTSHSVVAFTWQGAPVRVLLNSFNHLPDALEATRQFRDFWYFWGDVRQRMAGTGRSLPRTTLRSLPMWTCIRVPGIPPWSNSPTASSSWSISRRTGCFMRVTRWP